MTRETDTRPAVLKLGGELLEEPEGLARLAAAIVELAQAGPLVVVHGGGRSIDAALAREGIPKRAVDGLRITDAATLSVVVNVVAGGLNTRLVAAVLAAGGRPVGLTGVDAGIVPVLPAPPLRSGTGESVDLGLVGEPVPGRPPDLLRHLCGLGYLPIVACIGAADDGRLFNVNADTLAAHLAVALKAPRLLIGGTTPGVLDDRNEPMTAIDASDITRLIQAGTASAGMVAKLIACRTALSGGVDEVVVLDARDPANLRRRQGTTIRKAAA